MSGSIGGRLVLRRSYQPRLCRCFTEAKDAQEPSRPPAFTTLSENRMEEIARRNYYDQASLREETKRLGNNTQNHRNHRKPLLSLNKPNFQRKPLTHDKIPNENQTQRSVPPIRSALGTKSNWVQISNIPPMASLDDIVRSVNGVMDHEQQLGIVDLDGILQTNDTPPMVKRIHKEWVQSATFILSEHGRPYAWRIQFENRSLAHAFLQRAMAIPFRLVWKPVEVKEWNSQISGPEPLIKVNESMIRVENFPFGTSPDFMRHLFRRYDLALDGPTILPWESKLTGFKMFVVRFANPSWARAAVRELQGVEVENYQLRLAQYPKQII